jgi:AcrR family transcriptional regulator
LQAAETILAEDGADALTIQRIGKVAGVPVASVYHFFPTATAAAVALAQSYFAGFREGIAGVLAENPTAPWRDTTARIMAETVRFYREHPYALRLMFGSDHSWRVRQSDVANNALMARELALALGQCFDTRDLRADDLFALAISLSDAVWSLSFARHAAITPAHAREAERAVIAYLAQFERRSAPVLPG